MTSIRVLSAALVLTLATPALSQTATPLTDENGDGMLSFSELLLSYPTLDIDAYFAADTDGDGFLNPHETKTARDNGILPR
ncbi:MAG: hypothetical protein H6898_11420 [Rhodobacter sp.]|nr:hypothetical protein [Paracoccaceae bacterium]MCC0077176.1 hypothetical protein [Rhodobacter sp.]